MRAVLALAALLWSVAASAQMSVPGAPSTGGRAGFNVPAPLVASIDATGWSATWASGTPPTFAPDVTPQTFTAARQGFNTSGNLTTYTDTFIYTMRVRQPFPASAQGAGGVLVEALTPSTVALSDYVYSSATDTIVGVTNNSAEVSPKPVCNWVTPSRDLIPASGHVIVEVECFHRDGRNNSEVAAVVFTATDAHSSTPVSVTTSTPVVSKAFAVANYNTNDQHAVIVYRADIDTSTLTDQDMVTVNAKAYPWLGGTASINDTSANGTDVSQFTARYFLKFTARAAAIPLAYINPPVATFTGNAAAGGAVLNVTTTITGTLAVGQTITGTNIPASTTIASLGTGTGGVGSYNLSQTIVTAVAANTSLIVPPVAYGSGATAVAVGTSAGCWSSNDLVARAHPFDTTISAITAVDVTAVCTGVAGSPARGLPSLAGLAGVAATANYLDGIEIRVGQGTTSWNLQNFARYQAIANVVVTRDPAVAKASAILQLLPSATAIKWYNGYNPAIIGPGLKLRDLRVNIGTGGVFGGNGILELIYENVDLDLNNVSNVVSGLSSARVSAFGINMLNINPTTPGQFFKQLGSTQLVDRIRGLSCTCFGMNFSIKDVLTGSTINNSTNIGGVTITSFNAFQNLVGNGTSNFWALDSIPTGAALVQNTFETISNIPAVIWISGDAATSSTTHMIIQFNSIEGFTQSGRCNCFYDATDHTPRVHKLTSMVGNLWVQSDFKSDLFYGMNTGFSDASTGAAAHVNAWSVYYSVGRRGELYQYPGWNSIQFRSRYLGLGAVAGDSVADFNFIDKFIDPKFVFNGGMRDSDLGTDNSSAANGFGGSDMHLQTGSPAIDVVTRPPLPFDLDGVARGTVKTSAGAYAASAGH